MQDIRKTSTALRGGDNGDKERTGICIACGRNANAIVNVRRQKA